MQKSTKTEELIYWGCQYESEEKVAYVFKTSHESQDQIVIVFYNRGLTIHPNKGSKMRVSYHLDYLGQYHGTKLESTDPGAYD